MILSLFFQMMNRNIVEGLNSFPKFEYTPNREVVYEVNDIKYIALNSPQYSLSDSRYTVISLIPYNGDMNVQQLLYDLPRMSIDYKSDIIYNNESDGKIYAFGDSNNPLKFTKCSKEPTTFIKSIWDVLKEYIVNDMNLTIFSVFPYFEYNSDDLTITLKDNRDLTRTFTIRLKDNRQFQDTIIQALVKITPFDSSNYISVNFRCLDKDLGIQAKYMFEIKTKNGTIDKIHIDTITFMQGLLQQYQGLIQQLLEQYQNNIVINEETVKNVKNNIIDIGEQIINQIDSNIQTIIYNIGTDNVALHSNSIDNNNNVGGYIKYNDINYVLFVKTK